MPHIHTGPGEHDQTISAYIVHEDSDSPRLLLHKHKILNVFLQVGGHMELTENPWAAIEHEIREESGYTLQQLEILQPPNPRLPKLTGVVTHPFPVSYLTHKFGDADHYHVDTAFAFVAKEGPSQAIAEDEPDSLRFFTRDELTELTENQIPENVREIGLFVLEVCLPSWDRVDPSSFS